MADIKPVGVSAGFRGERRGHRGHRGPRGPEGPSGAPSLSEFFPFAIVTRTIYARATGSDETGDGTLENPFRTFQRAIAEVAVLTGGIIPNGKRYVVDITGIGIETLPDAYEMPSIIATTFISSADDPATVPFRFIAPLDIRAFPQPFSGIPVADTSVPTSDVLSITADPATGLVTITTATPRASWAADALKGVFLIGDVSARASSAIVSSNPTQIFIANILSQVVLQNFSIVEPSATLQGAIPSSETASFNCFNTPAVSFHGIRFRCLDPDPFAVGFALGNAEQPAMELCDVEGLVVNVIGEQFIFQANVLRTKAIDIEAAVFTVRQCLLLDIPALFFGADPVVELARSVVDGLGGSLGPSSVFIGGGSTGGRWEVLNTLVKGTTAGPAFAATGFGSWSFDTVVIQDTTGDAILVEGPTQVILNAVTGGTGGAGDPANTGVGVHAVDGGQARVLDDGTLVTGTGGDLQAGTLAARTWTNFRTIAPIKNEYDLTTPFVASTAGTVQPPGDELTGAGTGGRSGSRIYQRPI